MCKHNLKYVDSCGFLLPQTYMYVVHDKGVTELYTFVLLNDIKSWCLFPSRLQIIYYKGKDLDDTLF